MTSPDPVWVIDDDPSLRWVLERALSRAGFGVTAFDSGDAALRALAQHVPSVIVSDVRMQGTSGFDLLERIRRSHPQIPMILMTAHSDLDSAVRSYQGGAFEYLPKPFDLDDAVTLVRRALDLRREPRTGPPSRAAFEQAGLIGEAPAMQEVFRAIGRLWKSGFTTLIDGESGTGKELVARALHRYSPRAAQPFVALNIAAIPRELIESELFGHEKGAFTGATQQRKGRFEQASGGTLFLDEIGDMPMEAQTRLLRVLAEGCFYRVGGHTLIRTDVRIIAATHRDLEAAIRQGSFREDLFHRLNVIRIHLPRLSERREDIVPLAEFFLQRIARELNVEPRILLPDAAQYLSRLPWPGNVRQLENLCRWLTIMIPGREILVSDLPADQATPVAGDERPDDDWARALARWVDAALARGETGLLRQAQPAFERTMIVQTLRHTGGRRQSAARLLGYGRNTLTRKIQELRLTDDIGADGPPDDD